MAVEISLNAERGVVAATKKTLTCFAFASFRSKFGYLLLHLNFVARNLLQGILARGDELLGCPAICYARLTPKLVLPDWTVYRRYFRWSPLFRNVPGW